jgi:hypothetical protein
MTRKWVRANSVHLRSKTWKIISARWGNNEVQIKFKEISGKNLFNKGMNKKCCGPLQGKNSKRCVPGIVEILGISINLTYIIIDTYLKNITLFS